MPKEPQFTTLLTADVEAVIEEMAALRARVARLVELLREVEWGGIRIDHTPDGKRLLLERACPACAQGQSRGHRPGCPMAAALADGG